MIPNIGLFDILLGFGYLIFIYFIAIRWVSKQYNGVIYKWFIPALSMKIGPGILFALLSIYYYQSGDTFLYFKLAESLRLHLFIDPVQTLDTIFTAYPNLTQVEFNPLEEYNYYYDRSTTWYFTRLVLIPNLFAFGSYLVSTILMSTFSFLGVWLGFITLNKLYPGKEKSLFVALFMIPSVLLWSSGILRDSILIACFFVLIYGVFQLISDPKKWLLYLGILFITVFVMYSLRPFFILILLPFLLAWNFIYFWKNNINPGKWKVLGIIVFFCLLLGTLITLAPKNLDKYGFGNLFETLQKTQDYHTRELFAAGQNSYSLGGVVENPQDVPQKIPSAILVTLFRPYPWEVNNLPMFLGSVESLALFILLIYTLITSYRKIFYWVKLHPELLVFLLFVLFYSVVVGLSAYNFGALSRYKMLITILFVFILGSILQTPKPKET